MSEQENNELDPAELVHADPEFTDTPASDENDPNDINGPVDTGEGEPEDRAEETAKEPEEKDEDETEQLRKTVKALGKRVSVLSREKRDLSTKLQETIKPVETPAETDEPVRSDFKTQAEFDKAVRDEATRQRNIDAFNARCNDVEAAGTKAFGDKWPKAKADLAMLDDAGRIPMDILTVALETDDPARVLYVLGNDIEKATELMGMTPIKRAIAMDKIANTKPQERPQSRTPAPIDPLNGKGTGNDRPSDRDSDEEWNRKEAIRERRAAEDRRKLRGY